MGTHLPDRSGGERPAGERSADTLAAPAGAFNGFDHPRAVAAAVADELDQRDDSRAFSAEELRTAARGVVESVGPNAADDIRAWAWELLELLDADEDEFVDRYAAMVAWRLVERFDDTRGRARAGSGTDDAPSPASAEVDESDGEEPARPPGAQSN